MTDDLNAKAAIQYRDERESKEATVKPQHKPHASQKPVKPNGNEAPTGNQPPTYSDEALALRFAERHASDLRFVAAWGKWLSWTGTHWRHDDTLQAFDLVRRIIREVAAACNKQKIASAIASAKTVAAVERLSKSDRCLAATNDQWDDYPNIINTPTKDTAL